jgi:hypothetical protein
LASETELTPLDDGFSAGLKDGSVPDAVIVSAVSSAAAGANSNGPGGEVFGTGADLFSFGSARAPARSTAVTAAASPAASDAPAQRDPQIADRNSTSASGEVAEVRVGSIPAVTAPTGGGQELGSAPDARAARVDIENDGWGGSGTPPRYSDLLVEFLPFDRSSLENAIDRFLEGFETLGTELSDMSEPAGLVPALVGTALTAVAAGFTLRQLLARHEDRRSSAEEAEDDLAGFAGFPKSWRLEEA